VTNPEPLQWISVLDNIEDSHADSEDNSTIVDEDLAHSHKRRHQLPIMSSEIAPDQVQEISIAPSRHSTRSNRYQGFKQQLIGGAPKHKSYVKPRRVPGKKVENSNKGKKISEEDPGDRSKQPE
jgi:hypothetical protein